MAARNCPVNKILEDEHGNNEKHTINLTHLPECESKGRREVESKARFMRVIFTCWKTERVNIGGGGWIKKWRKYGGERGIWPLNPKMGHL